MDAKFKKAVDKTLEHEGGYCEIKGDSGGATNYGISLRFLKGYYPNCHLVDINNDGSVNKDDIKNLTKDDAKKIYHSQFWLKNKCDQIVDDILAAKFFDMSVNMGLSQAARILQRAVGHFKLFNIVEDGKIGAKTLQAVNQIKPDQLLCVLKKECETFYTNLATKNPELKKFLNGWLKRADS